MRAWGAHKIASIFREEKCPAPHGGSIPVGKSIIPERFKNPQNQYEWSHTIIRNMIGNPVSRSFRDVQDGSHF